MAASRVHRDRGSISAANGWPSRQIGRAESTPITFDYATEEEAAAAAEQLCQAIARPANEIAATPTGHWLLISEAKDYPQNLDGR